jgi:hypothetical protein
VTILLWQRMDGWLAAWREPDRSSPYDAKWGATAADAVARLDLGHDQVP